MTPPREASPAPASDPEAEEAATPRPSRPAGRLLLPAREIVDPEALRAALWALDPPRRAAIVPLLQEALSSGRARLAEAFAAAPTDARALVASYAYLTDVIVTAAFEVAAERMHPDPLRREGERLALLAVGGYGRAEMAPASDVDLLFLVPGKVTPRVESVVEETLYILWDLRMKVGHATRTVRECLRLGKDDFTIRTSLLEVRALAGDAELATTLTERLRDELFASTGRQFIAAKLEEREERHRKQGGQRYMLEPNVKEGKGGLRDLQSLYWIAKYIHGVDDIAALVGMGVFRREEYEAFAAAEEFLWAVRAHLHLIAKRAMDQLTFDMQVEVAARMGYTDHGGRRAVEHFMQAYFRHATHVGDLTRIFLTALEAAQAKTAPPLQALFRRRKVREGYDVKHGRLTVTAPDRFLEDPLNILRFFDEALRTGLLMHPDVMRLIAANLHLIDDPMRRDPEAARIFLDLMLRHGNPERALRRMNELGVLSAFVPEFEPIVAMMQFNVYHSYTVDEHTIQVIKALAEIENGALVEELPLASRIVKGDINRKVLYVALLLHDIGKGRPQDHSILGARIARTVAPRLRLKKEECETVEWLVRYHLTMSDFAQKRDVSDPRTVRDFAKIVKTKKRLDLLTVLTVCDIRGVGPNTWNNWKAQLLRTLYRETATALEEGMEALNRDRRGDEARRALRAALPDWPERDLRVEIGRHYPPYWQGLPTEAHAVFAELLRTGIPAGEVRTDLTPDPDRDATRVCFALADHPGLFARMAGALALVGANVVDARTYTTKDGYATAIFWVQDDEGAPFEAERLPRLREMILKTLAGEVVAGRALQRRDKLKRREQDFRFPTSVLFDNEGSDIYTIIEVDTRDRPGLLHDLARTLAGANIYISSAMIATYGAQVVDTFYVKDMFGLKIRSEARQAALERRLRAAIAAGAERAHRTG